MVRMIGALTGAVAALLLLGASAASADDFGVRVSGQHVYDRAGVLPAGRVADLESQAAGLDREGAPTVVYLRRQAASDQATRQDARDLMDAWDVESAPGARDGLVVFLNLRPADPTHGSAALVAGAALGAGGRLTDSRLQAIFEGDMRPRLAAGDIAGAISAALAAASADLDRPAAGHGAAAAPSLGGLAAGVLDLLAGLLAAAAGGWLVLSWTRSRHGSGPPSLSPPNPDTPAAVAGALAAGRPRGEWLAATVLDLARKGALRIETGPPPRIAIRLLDAGRATAPVEQRVLARLAAAADAGGLVDLGNARGLTGLQWTLGQDVTATLVGGGLFARRPARGPATAVASLALGAGSVVAVATAVTLQPLLLVGAVVLLGAGAGGLAVGLSMPDTTPEGGAAARAWRGLRAGLRSAPAGTVANDQLGVLLPFAVALGVPMEAHVWAAGQRGWRPEWLVGDPGADLLAIWRALLWKLVSRPAVRSGASPAGHAYAGAATVAPPYIDASGYANTPASGSFDGGASSGSSSGGGSF